MPTTTLASGPGALSRFGNRFRAVAIFFALVGAMISSTTPAARSSESEPLCEWSIVKTVDHDPGAFTQGLQFVDGRLFESTGLYKESTLRELDPDTGQVLRKISLAPEFFGEGMTLIDDRIYQITWREQTGFVYDRDTFKRLGQFSYTGEGWGLTTDGKLLILSDGSSQIRFIDPTSFATVRTIDVTNERQQRITQINELEFVDGAILANLWHSNAIARIDPETGSVIGWFDLSTLLGGRRMPGVLNGIAWIRETGHLLVTGKNWPWMFELEWSCPH